jgi:hypothetical protein
VDRLVDDGSISDLPWASVFDPAANARALSAIQAEGFRAASHIVDRFVRATEANGNGAGADILAVENGTRRPSADFEQMAKSWWSMVGQLLLGVAPGVATGTTGGATLNFASADAGRQICLEAAAEGQAVGEVWLHNSGKHDFGEVGLRCSDLWAHNGCVISSGAVSFEPTTFQMAARSSRGAELRIDVPHDVWLGLYRGMLLVDGHADLWLPMLLTVRRPVS